MFVCVFAKKVPALASQSCCEVSRPRAVGEYEYRLLIYELVGLATPWLQQWPWIMTRRSKDMFDNGEWVLKSPSWTKKTKPIIPRCVGYNNCTSIWKDGLQRFQLLLLVVHLWLIIRFRFALTSDKGAIQKAIKKKKIYRSRKKLYWSRKQCSPAISYLKISAVQGDKPLSGAGSPSWRPGSIQ